MMPREVAWAWARMGPHGAARDGPQRPLRPAAGSAASPLAARPAVGSALPARPAAGSALCFAR
jgi:hypothetical protein